MQVHAAGVNPYDTYMRAGTYAIKPPLPYTPGRTPPAWWRRWAWRNQSEAGRSRVHGENRDRRLRGICAGAGRARSHRLPDNITFEQGAGIWVPYGTAYHALHHHAKARAGETVLVHGASGGVGTRGGANGARMGLTVFGTAGTDKGLDLVKREGRASSVQSQQSGLSGRNHESHRRTQGVDIILEMLANVNLGGRSEDAGATMAG